MIFKITAVWCIRVTLPETSELPKRLFITIEIKHSVLNLNQESAGAGSLGQEAGRLMICS